MEEPHMWGFGIFRSETSGPPRGTPVAWGKEEEL